MLTDDYDFVKLIGKGKYGEVWQVFKKSSKKPFAVKKLELLGQSEEEHVTLRHESELLSSLSHPNIVACYGFFEVPGSHLCIVMQYCDGGDLRSRLQQQDGELILENQIMEWFIQVCMAIQYLHAQHILHRDLKTQNIFLTRTKFVKLGDFGIARALKNGCDMAETFIGTPYYMSPELFANKPYNSKTDMWSLGCCLHEMMTLKYAFTASSLPALMKIIAKGQIPTLPKKYSKELTMLCKQLLNPKPSQRPSANKVLKMPLVITHITRFEEECRSMTGARNGDSTRSCPEGAAGLTWDSEDTLPSADRVQGAAEDMGTVEADVDNGTLSVTATDEEAGVLSSTAEDTSTKSRTARKKKRFLKNRAVANQTDGKCDLPPKPLQKKPWSKQPIKPRPLPMPPISATGEPVHRKEVRRVPANQIGSATEQLSDSSSTGQLQGSSTSASSLEEIKQDGAELGTLNTVRSSTNFKARRKRREKNSLAMSSSIELMRLHGVSATPRLSPPQTLQASTHSSASYIAVNAEQEAKGSIHPAFRHDDKQKLEEESTDDMTTMIGLLNQTLIRDKPVVQHVNGSSYQTELPKTQTENVNGNGHKDLTDTRHQWIEDEPPDIYQTKKDRYIALREDCSQAIGSALFHLACQIIETESEDTMEMQLVDLLGPEKYEEYALKIWQLKFMRENMDSVT